jgi:hypothetical protein
VDLELKVVEKALHEGRGGLRPAIGEDLEIDKAGSAVDGDIGIAAAAVERQQVFDVDVDKARWGIGVKGHRRGFVAGQAGRDPVPLQAAVGGAARQLGIEAAVGGAARQLGIEQRRIASTMSSSGKARLRRSSTTRASSHRVSEVFSRCGRVERSVTSGRAFQRATVRLWMPSSRAKTALEAWLFWM